MAKLRKAGYALALLGFAIALVCLVPGLFGKEEFPWPILVGSFIYLNGAFLVMFSTRGKDARKALGSLRFVRLGFVAVFAVLVWKILAP